MKEILDSIKLREIAQLRFKMKQLSIAREEKQKLWDYSKPWEEYKELTKEEDNQLAELSRQLRLIRPYEVSDIPDYGDVMTLNQFKNHCKNGGFIDYDGYGHYIEPGYNEKGEPDESLDKMTDIVIYPSDVKHKSLRIKLNKIIWFNR